MTDYEHWLKKAVDKISDLESESIFLLKELFHGTEWNTLSYGDRRELGRLFKYRVNYNTIANVVYIGKAQNGSAKYQRI